MTSTPPPAPHDIVTAGPLRVDRASHQATLHGHTAILTARELEVLLFFCAQRGRVCSAEDIAAVVWGQSQKTNSIAVHVKRLRAKLPLERTHGGPLIWNVRGAGYRLAPVLVDDAEPHLAAPHSTAIVPALPAQPEAPPAPPASRQTPNDSAIIEAMNIERSVSVEQRVAMHAALADPHRLRIVDYLALGDASPSELQTALSMPSNLVAHHLNVLQASGLVLRDTSHADRRRTYVRLAPTGLRDLLPVTSSPASRVVFVCTQNSARSQLATALWNQQSAIPSTSAGTHPADQINPLAVDAAQRHRLTLADQQPQLLDDVLRPDDLVVVVCDNAHEHLPTGLARLHWSVPDPVTAAQPSAFDAVVDELSGRISTLAHAVGT
ncbi:winged helix-turn-helix domain-containing protein (plasmid) [Mycobacterium sp. smrl_JER01]|uniref:winged helix-turn-helix domain-containing protein n=1 Tax=Mycobacteriaceae TaxID=1762 RepID=UPI002FDAD9B9